MLRPKWIEILRVMTRRRNRLKLVMFVSGPPKIIPKVTFVGSTRLSLPIEGPVSNIKYIRLETPVC